jgi:hypothetical protein
MSINAFRTVVAILLLATGIDASEEKMTGATTRRTVWPGPAGINKARVAAA